ncbi:polyprenyl synthetase family protein [Streptomyces sp. R1]|uniref:polyprenyl synthetase family protein n=1 Tax=Streptomyces sp. R1 TaxID=1509279 RepID=UPI001E641A3E|nr:polyprenyl synthetase family protein [Streptomyces sp. R1]MCC8340715.1 polyprenyl synthetase family protein [Streptomyces sp. R1]
MLILDSRTTPEDAACTVWAELPAEDLVRYEAIQEEALEAQREYLSEAEYTIYRRGKRLRPAILLLAARMVHGPAPLPAKVVQGAVSLEMLHVATLIHDDVVDDSMLRRGMPSVNAARGPGTAVIVGDLQFVQAVRGFVDAIDRDSDMALVKLVLDSAFDTCRGELDELRTDLSQEPAVLVQRYWETADRKTAVLFGLAAESGVVLADGHSSDARRAGFFGRGLGRAFQVMDDLFDLSRAEDASGKPCGVDLLRGCASLPLIYAMAELGPAHRVTRTMRGDPADPAALARVLAQVRATGAFARAYADARERALDALKFLRPFPDNRYRRALHDLTLHVVDRSP